MTSNEQDNGHGHAIIGNPNGDFWLYHSSTGFDLTHPASPTGPKVSPSLTIQTTTEPIAVDPAKSALVIIDMQNYFLSPALGRVNGAGHAALEQLVEYAIPAAREAGMQIVWLNWGLTGKELEEMPPTQRRAFGFTMGGAPVDRHGKARPGGHGGLGSALGVRKDETTGREFDAGRVLMRSEWNSGLYPPLDRIFSEGQGLPTRPDVWIHKNRFSGLWDTQTSCAKFLESQGIRTLFFAGVNTDQCVGGTLQDACSKGYDCILLSDGCGTSSPEFAQRMMEFNGANTWGFLTSCYAFADGAKEEAKLEETRSG